MMKDIDVSELKLPAFLVERASMKKILSAIQRSGFESSSCVVFNNEVIGGFSAYLKARDDGGVVSTVLYDGDSSPVQVALHVLLNVARECLLLKSEHQLLKDAFKKLNDVSVKAGFSPLAFPDIFPVHDVFVQHVAQGSVPFMRVLELVKVANEKEQLQLSRNWKGQDIASCLASWLDSGSSFEERALDVELLSEDDVRDLKELESLESRITELDDSIKSALYEKGRILAKINEEKLYRLKGRTFKEYCSETFGLSGGYCFKILKMYRLTPNLMKETSVSRLSWIHEHITDDNLIMLNRDRKLVSNDGEVSFDEIVRNTLSVVEGKILPFARPSVIKRVKNRGVESSVGQIDQYMKLIKKQLKNMNSVDKSKAMDTLLESFYEIRRS